MGQRVSSAVVFTEDNWFSRRQHYTSRICRLEEIRSGVHMADDCLNLLKISPIEGGETGYGVVVDKQGLGLGEIRRGVRGNGRLRVI